MIKNLFISCMRLSIALVVVGGLGFGASELAGAHEEPDWCHYSAGACSNTGCDGLCAGQMWRCQVVTGPTGEDCSCTCIKIE